MAGRGCPKGWPSDCGYCWSGKGSIKGTSEALGYSSNGASTKVCVGESGGVGGSSETEGPLVNLGQQAISSRSSESEILRLGSSSKIRWRM